jgi:predicted DNA-binding transcriptional regulator AlpA
LFYSAPPPKIFKLIGDQRVNDMDVDEITASKRKPRANKASLVEVDEARAVISEPVIAPVPAPAQPMTVRAIDMQVVAAALGVSVPTVKRLVRIDPTFPKPSTLSRSAARYWLVSEIEAWLLKQAANARAKSAERK